MTLNGCLGGADGLHTPHTQVCCRARALLIEPDSCAGHVRLHQIPKEFAMSRTVDRAINHYRLTQGPLRCLSALDPCGRNFAQEAKAKAEQRRLVAKRQTSRS